MKTLILTLLILAVPDSEVNVLTLLPNVASRDLNKEETRNSHYTNETILHALHYRLKSVARIVIRNEVKSVVNFFKLQKK